MTGVCSCRPCKRRRLPITTFATVNEEGRYRGMMAYLMDEHGGLDQRMMGEELGMTTGASVSIRVRALKEEMNKNKKRGRQIKRVEQALFE